MTLEEKVNSLFSKRASIEVFEEIEYLQKLITKSDNDKKKKELLRRVIENIYPFARFLAKDKQEAIRTISLITSLYINGYIALINQGE